LAAWWKHGYERVARLTAAGMSNSFYIKQKLMWAIIILL
jgi:hypothetical protein